MIDRVCLWSGTSGKIVSQGIVFEIDKKPNLGFTYDSVFYEPATNMSFFTTTWKDSEGNDSVVKLALSEEDIAQIHKYCDEFIEKEDYEVSVYNSDNIFIGVYLKSQAVANKLKYSITSKPATPIAKYIEEKDDFYPVFVVFKEEGFPIFNPTTLTDDMVLFLTKEEWDQLPERKNYKYSLDFTTNKWVDKRELDKVKTDAIMSVRLYFDHAKIQTHGDFKAGYRTPTEMAQWTIQEQEAHAYKKDNKALTPFLDGFLSVNSQLTKEELVNKILDDYTKASLKRQGKLHGEMYNYIYRIKQAETNDAVDSIMNEVYKRFKKYKLINKDQSYPGPEAGPEEETIVMVGGMINHGLGSI